MITIVSIIFSGCGNGLDDKYNTPSTDFKGLNFECVTGGDTINQVRNRMVYFDLSDFIIADQKEKGNEINSIMVDEASADVFHDTYTVANLSVTVDAKSGDIKSGDYNVQAFFSYDTKNPNDTKMYLLNYCFSSSSEINTDLFEDSYEIVKDKE